MSFSVARSYIRKLIDLRRLAVSNKWEAHEENRDTDPNSNPPFAAVEDHMPIVHETKGASHQ